MNSMTGETGKVKSYQLRADTLKNLIETKLWNEQQQFFETHRGDSSANVREAIGYIPWYFNLPDVGSKYEVVWQQLLDEKGYRLGNCDITICAEQPKMNPHIPAMQQQLAECLQCHPDQVSIKATTTERLGYTGRGEGIAAHAVALIVKSLAVPY